MQKIRIGTRKSPLALWQAQLVAQKLNEVGQESIIVPITSEGDQNLKQPIYALGITGVFTRSLDIALLNDQIDIAVHSLKDVPTTLPEGLEWICSLERGNPTDILVYKNDDVFDQPKRKIATGSLRRKSFWLNRFPQDEVVDLRGNVQLRLQKLIDSDCDGAVFAYAGLERSGILAELENQGLKFKILDWMVPAPSQGIIGITAKSGFEFAKIGCPKTHLAATIERTFLNLLEGGCTAPIGAHAEFKDDEIHFTGAILSINGQELIQIEENFSVENAANKGEILAQKCIEKGADKLIKTIKENLKK